MTVDTVLRTEGLGRPVHSAGSIFPDSEPAAPEIMIPVTKVPALDVIDQYALGKPISDGIGHSALIKLTCDSDIENIDAELLSRYASFISAFTGLDDIAFAVWRRGIFATGSRSQQAIAHASLSAVVNEEEQLRRYRQCSLREIDYAYYRPEEVQFRLELDSPAEFTNGGGNRNTEGSKEVCYLQRTARYD